MSSKPTHIGLSANEVSELMQLRDSYQSKIGYKVSDAAAALGVSLDVLAGDLPAEPPAEEKPARKRKGKVFG
jgi:hypothetical protein